MGILKLIKNIITNNYEKNTITRSTKDLYLLFDFLYFIRKNKEFPKNKKLVENMNIVIKVLCKKETYDAINRYFYVFSSIIYNLIISISIKNAPFYLYVVGDLMILFITILIEIFLARKDQIRFSVTLLINSLLVIIVILEGEPERMVNAISNIQSEHLPILKEKTQKFSSSDQVKKTRSSISLETRYGDLYREKIILNSLEQAAKYVESYIPRRLDAITKVV